MSLATKIERLIAQQEIRDVIYRYARGVDRIDTEVLLSAFWEDGGYREHYSDEPMHKIADGLVNGLLATTFSSTQHLIGNILINFAGQDTAHAETYLLAFHLTHPNLGEERLEGLMGPRRFAELGRDADKPYEIVVGGRYLDIFTCRSDEWRIKERRLIYDFTTIHAVSGLTRGEGLSEYVSTWSARDSSDPSYTF